MIVGLPVFLKETQLLLSICALPTKAAMRSPSRRITAQRVADPLTSPCSELPTPLNANIGKPARTTANDSAATSDAITSDGTCIVELFIERMDYVFHSLLKLRACQLAARLDQNLQRGL